MLCDKCKAGRFSLPPQPCYKVHFLMCKNDTAAQPTDGTIHSFRRFNLIFSMQTCILFVYRLKLSSLSLPSQMHPIQHEIVCIVQGLLLSSSSSYTHLPSLPLPSTTYTATIAINKTPKWNERKFSIFLHEDRKCARAQRNFRASVVITSAHTHTHTNK